MQLSDTFLQQWSHIVSTVEKTDFPLECINKMIIRMEGRKQKTINIARLKKQGLDLEAIEALLTRSLLEYGNEVVDIDFVVDIKSVAALVQPETDKLLNGL
jgi:hypothetical protein